MFYDIKGFFKKKKRQGHEKQYSQENDGLAA